MPLTSQDIQTLIVQGVPTLLPPRKLTADEVDGMCVGLARLLAATVLGAMGASDDDIECAVLHRTLATTAVVAMQERFKEWRGRN